MIVNLAFVSSTLRHPTFSSYQDLTQFRGSFHTMRNEVQGREGQEKRPCSVVKELTSGERKQVSALPSRRPSWALYHIRVWTS